MTHEVSCTQGAGTGLSTYMRSSRAIQVDSCSWFHVKQGRFWAFACPSSCRYDDVVHGVEALRQV